jgi:hypothetical protein
MSDNQISSIDSATYRFVEAVFRLAVNNLLLTHGIVRMSSARRIPRKVKIPDTVFKVRFVHSGSFADQTTGSCDQAQTRQLLLACSSLL